MLRSYWKIAWRNILRSRFYSLVNIIGLSAGIAFTLLIAAYVWSEVNVNRGLRNADRQFIIQSKWKDPNLGLDLTSLGQLAKVLKEEYPNLVANYYRWDGIGAAVSKGDRVFREGIQIGDSTLLLMYGFRLSQGDPRYALSGPGKVVITEERAKKYFGRTDVLGQSLTIENFRREKKEFVISGVMKNPSRNSVTFLTDENDNQVYVSTDNLGFFSRNMDWANPYIVSFIELKPGVDAEDIAGPMKQLLRLHTSAAVADNLEPYAVELKQYYLSANNGMIRKMLYTLSFVGLFILLMAVINFVNLTVSRSATRMREIGVRKVLGGLRKQLIGQFLVESILLVFLSTILAILIYILSREFFSVVLQKPIPSLLVFPVYSILFPILLIMIVGFIAGIYPAFVLSSLKSVESLKGKLDSVKENVILRKSLVGFQYTMSIIVFVSALLVSSQVKYFFSKDLGYKKDYLLSAVLPRDWSPQGIRQMEVIRKEFVSLPQVNNASLSFGLPDGSSPGVFTVHRESADSNQAVASQNIFADENFADTYSIPMAAGVFFGAPGTISDSSKLVINESLARALGWKDVSNAIGSRVRDSQSNITFTITGVTKDFNFGSLQQSIPPVAFVHVTAFNLYRTFTFKLNPGDLQGSIAAVENKWNEVLPGAPFEFAFMDESLANLYRSEIQLKQASYVATGLSLIIVLLGVVGLVSLNIRKRTREIGIRKVLGSSVSNIISLFLKEIVFVIAVSGLVACPIAYLLMNKWLNDYVYRIDISPWPFVITMVLLGAVTSLLVMGQTIRAALANPVDSLRTE